MIIPNIWCVCPLRTTCPFDLTSYDVAGECVTILKCIPLRRSSPLNGFLEPRQHKTPRASFLDLGEGEHWLSSSVAQSDAAFRVCPGQKFADANVFLVTASVLATMNIFSPDPADAARGVSCDDFASGLTR